MKTKQTEASSNENHAQTISSVQQQYQPRIYQVTDGLHAEHTKTNYRLAFKQFLKNGAKTYDLQVLLDHKPKVLEQMVIGYVEMMRDQGKAYQTIKMHCAAIFHFFRMNDITLNQRKITSFVPPNDSTNSDKPYTLEEIGSILAACGGIDGGRSKAIILLLTSTGMRIGAIPELTVGHLTPVPQHDLYKIEVYANSRRWRYSTYCTPECKHAIDAYLEYRRRKHEQITDKSPLLREMFDANNPFIINAPRQPTEKMVYSALEQALKDAGVNQRTAALGKGKRRNIMRSHGFRKFYITCMKKAKIDFSDRHALVGHKSNIKNDLNYDRTEDIDRLEEYVKAIPLLTIDPTKRLEKENQELRKDYLAELGELREEFNQMKSFIVSLDKDRQKKLVHKFHKETENEVMDEYTDWVQDTTEGQEWYRKNVQQRKN